METAERGMEIPRVELSRAGLARLSGLSDPGRPMSAELTDRRGELCGRARKMGDAASSIYSDGHTWHIQIGGVIARSDWASAPMGCGSGETPYDAACAALDDLRRRSEELARQAARVAEMIGGRT
jgi:hypothetical protein